MKLLSNNLPFDEVVDTYVDAVGIYRDIREPLRDGFDFPDLFAIYKAYPAALEIYNDRNIFVDQLLDLTPEESVLVYDQVSQRTGEPRDGVELVASKSLRVSLRTYRLVRHNMEEVKEILIDIKEIGGTIRSNDDEAITA